MDNNNNSGSSPSIDAEKALKNKLKNEAKRKEKAEKFAAKQAKLAAMNKKTKPSSPSQKVTTPGKGEPNSTPVSTFVNKTPKGEKKDLSEPMANSYDPSAVESAWYDYWEEQGCFKPNDNSETYTVVLPPPNVTGSLHLGHALTIAIQDCMIRWNRMHQRSTLFLPGIDHAGIATQVVVEKMLWKQSKKTRHDLGREGFNAEVWKWKSQYGSRIYDQTKRLGASNHWDMATFSMDQKLVDAVNEAFVRLHDEGVIYRENRLVNWCTKLRTALSNLEVENREVEGRTLLSVPDHDPSKKYEFGVIISFAYPVKDSTEKIIVATTRIETMLGDSAVAVHPNDKRYTHLVGKFVEHPFSGRKIPIIADDYVDAEFGTGAVKITPAHDFNDFAVGKRHNLEMINIFNDDGTLNEFGGEFKGMKRFDARVAVQTALEERGLYVETKDNKMVLPICGRSNNVVEPLLKPQWYVNCQDMAKDAMEAVRKGDLEIQPATSEKEWFRWLENIQDWCISRQLWWGHRIPAYLISIKGERLNAAEDPSWVSGKTIEEARAKALARFPDEKGEDIGLHQDPDVLDTWFSSGLWPFATLGWPKKTPELDKFYPNSLLETGWDILFFWVARMVMFGIKLTGEVPFKKVFCHAMVRDAHGRKMSKSLGNVIDPVSVIDGITLEELHRTLEGGNLDSKEVQRAQDGQKRDFPKGIQKCGADALRFTLLNYTSTGRDINLDVLRIEGYRKFCNKLWNATKFAMMKLGDSYVPEHTVKISGKESLCELWILSKLARAVKEVNTNLHDMSFMSATSCVYNFWIYELCDVYIEVCKTLMDSEDPEQVSSAKNMLYTCLEYGLRMLHPMMPFVTEELYQRLPGRDSSSNVSISTTKYPEFNKEWENSKAEVDFGLLNEVVHACRSLIVEYGVKNATVYIQPLDEKHSELIKAQDKIILNLVKGLSTIEIVSEAPKGCALFSIREECNILLLVKGVVDCDAEITKLKNKLGKVGQQLESNRKKTQVADYESKVKVEVRTANEQKIKALEAEIGTLNATIANFEQLLK